MQAIDWGLYEDSLYIVTLRKGDKKFSAKFMGVRNGLLIFQSKMVTSAHSPDELKCVKMVG